MKMFVATALACGISATFGLAAVQAQPTTRYDAGTQTCRTLTLENLQEGYRLFRSECKVCHHRGNDEGAGFLYTESKGMKGWNRVFASRYPGCAAEGRWEKLSPEDQLRINDYLYANAFGASNPHCSV